MYFGGIGQSIMHRTSWRRMQATLGILSALALAAACSGAPTGDDSGSIPLKAATIVTMRPNSLYSRSFAQVADLAPGESSSLLATGFIAGSFVGHTQFYDSVTVDQTMTWTSRSPEIATIDGTGLVTGRSPGMATIVVQGRGGVALDSGIVIVQQRALRLVTLVPGDYMCGLDAGGGAWCWGYGVTTADPPTVASLTGTRFPANATGGDKKYSSLSTTYSAACGIATDGITYCWAIRGTALFGTTVASNTPVAFGPDLRFVTVLAGGQSACGLTGDGALYCWGDNSNGQFGDGTKVSRTTPTLVTGGLRFSAISIGTTSCGISVEGDSYCWGSMGRDANLNPVFVTVPLKVATTERFVEIRTGPYHVCGRTSAGVVSCWGENKSGELGDGTTSNRLSPVRTSGGYLFSSISVGDLTTCGVTTDGRGVCWGMGGYGSLGDGTFTGLRLTPTLVSGNLRFTSLTASRWRTCGQSSGVHYCWGDNTNANMGINHMDNVNVPTRLAGLCRSTDEEYAVCQMTAGAVSAISSRRRRSRSTASGSGMSRASRCSAAVARPLGPDPRSGVAAQSHRRQARHPIDGFRRSRCSRCRRP
jgi:alpha-tubulin suppressor-like RCC1 family protein